MHNTSNNAEAALNADRLAHDCSPSNRPKEFATNKQNASLGQNAKRKRGRPKINLDDNPKAAKKPKRSNSKKTTGTGGARGSKKKKTKNDVVMISDDELGEDVVHLDDSDADADYVPEIEYDIVEEEDDEESDQKVFSKGSVKMVTLSELESEEEDEEPVAEEDEEDIDEDEVYDEVDYEYRVQVVLLYCFVIYFFLFLLSIKP